jgi:hypothetical protein
MIGEKTIESEENIKIFTKLTNVTNPGDVTPLADEVAVTLENVKVGLARHEKWSKEEVNRNLIIGRETDRTGRNIR